MVQPMTVRPALITFAFALICAQLGRAQAEEKQAPFEMEVLLTEHQRKLEDGTIKLTKMTIGELEKVQSKYLRAKRTDDALQVAKAIEKLEASIKKIQDQREAERSGKRSATGINLLREAVTEGKWLRVGRRAGIGRSIYAMKPDGSAEGFILTATDEPGKKTAWNSWKLRGKELQLGTETFTYDEKQKIFVGSMSDLIKPNTKAKSEK